MSVYLAGNVRILAASPKVQSTGADPMIRMAGWGFREMTIYALVAKPWLGLDLGALECRLCVPESQSILLCPYTADAIPGEAVVNARGPATASFRKVYAQCF
ncbi:unnamed protein product [Effrenium voratum]|nr:unnamed protein product [Effrenium voratum]